MTLSGLRQNKHAQAHFSVFYHVTKPKNKIHSHVTKQETKAFLCDQLKVISNVSQLVLSDRGHGNNNAALTQG